MSRIELTPYCAAWFLVLSIACAPGCEKAKDAPEPAPAPGATAAAGPAATEPTTSPRAPSDRTAAAGAKSADGPVVLTTLPTTRPLPPAKFKLAAKAMKAEYGDDPVAAAKKYGNQVVEVTGEVYSVLQTRDGDAYLDLDGSMQESGLKCYTAHPRPWGVVARGQQVTVRGTGNDEPFRFPLLDCEIVAVGPSPAARVAADELARQFAKDRRAFDATYTEGRGKTVVVTGAVRSNVPGQDETRLVLDGAGGVTVEAVFFLPLDRESVASLKPGQTVTIYSPSVSAQENAVELRFCLLVSP